MTQEELDQARLAEMQNANQLGEKNYNLQKNMGIADLGMSGLGAVLNIYGSWQDRKDERANRRENLRRLNEQKLRQMQQDQLAQEQQDFSNAQTGQQGAASLRDGMLDIYKQFGA